MLALFSTVFYVDKQKILWTDICSAKEVGYVKKDNASVVRCEYTASEKQLPQLLEESFRLYLARILAMAKPDTISYGR